MCEHDLCGGWRCCVWTLFVWGDSIWGHHRWKVDARCWNLICRNLLRGLPTGNWSILLAFSNPSWRSLEPPSRVLIPMWFYNKGCKSGITSRYPYCYRKRTYPLKTNIHFARHYENEHPVGGHNEHCSFSYDICQRYCFTMYFGWYTSLYDVIQTI